MSDRLNAWRNRVINEMLGRGYGLWDLGRPKAAVHARLAAKVKRLGRNYDDDDIAYMLVEHQLVEVLNAAAGVDRSLEAMKRHALITQQRADDYFASQPRSSPPPDRQSWTDEEVVHVWYEFINMLVWTRALQDRVQRKGIGKDPQQGLLPSLASGPLKTAVESAFAILNSGHAREARFFTNYGVHAGLVPSPGTPNARIQADGTLWYVLPDTINTPIEHWQEFSFSTERDALAFADELFQQVETFIDQILDAFLQAVPT